MEKNMVIEKRAEKINGLLTSMDAGFSVLYEQIPKNNVTKDAYILRPRDDGMMSPTIYLNGEMLEKTDGELATCLMEMYMHHKAKAPDMTSVLSRERILDTVLPRLVSAQNAERLNSRDLVYEKILDLLVYYYLPLDEISGSDGIATVSVSRAILNNAGLTADDIKTAALENMRGTVDIVSMSDMLQSLGFPMSGADDCPIWIVTNKTRHLGAAAILVKEVQDDLQNRLGSCWYMLPSSIHECLAVPATADTDAIEFVRMVKEINESQVSLEDRLVDGAYLFKDGQLSILA